MSKTGTVIDDKLTRKNLKFIRIGNRSSSSYLKVITQSNHHILPPIIKVRQLSNVFLKSISIDIETINWSEHERVSVPAICKNLPSNSSKSTSTSSYTSTSISHDNPPILQSMYPILDELNMNTSKLDDKPLDINFFLIII